MKCNQSKFPAAFQSPTYNQTAFNYSSLEGKIIKSAQAFSNNWGTATVIDFTDGSQLVVQCAKYQASLSLKE